MQQNIDNDLPTNSICSGDIIYLDENASSYENAICEQFSTDGFIIINEEAANTSKQVWLEAPTKLMLALLSELQPQVGKTAYLKNKQKLWKVVAENLKMNGYIFTPLQVQTKFRSLERQYKKVRLNNSRTGRNPISCQYQSELENLLGDKKGINPDFVLDSNDAIGKTAVEKAREEDVVNCSDSDCSDTPCTSREKISVNNFIPAKKRSTQDKALDILKSMADEKKLFQDKMLQIMKEKEEISKRREFYSKRKIELLETITSKFSKEN